MTGEISRWGKKQRKKTSEEKSRWGKKQILHGAGCYISVVLEYIQKYGLTMYIYSKYVGTVPFFKKWP